MRARLPLALMLIVFTQTVIAEPCNAPKNLADGWAIESNSQAAGFDQTRLCEVLKNFAESNINFHSLIVERRGRLVAEVYKRGKDESIHTLFASSTDFDVTTRHDVRSISKSVMSLLWGIAQTEGKTPALNTPVLDLLPALADR